MYLNVFESQKSKNDWHDFIHLITPSGSNILIN